MTGPCAQAHRQLWTGRPRYAVHLKHPPLRYSLIFLRFLTVWYVVLGPAFSNAGRFIFWERRQRNRHTGHASQSSEIGLQL